VQLEHRRRFSPVKTWLGCQL